MEIFFSQKYIQRLKVLEKSVVIAMFVTINVAKNNRFFRLFMLFVIMGPIYFFYAYYANQPASQRFHAASLMPVSQIGGNTKNMTSSNAINEKAHSNVNNSVRESNSTG